MHDFAQRAAAVVDLRAPLRIAEVEDRDLGGGTEEDAVREARVGPAYLGAVGAIFGRRRNTEAMHDFESASGAYGEMSSVYCR